jgi:hypothetical protein
VFFDRFGQARSASAVYAELSGRYDRARAAAFTPALRGTVAPDPAQTASTGPGGPPDTAAMAQAFAAARDEQPRPAARQFFESMFSDRGGAPVANAVSNLWAGPARGEATPNGVKPQTRGAVNPLDLFVDAPRRARALFGGQG